MGASPWPMPLTGTPNRRPLRACHYLAWVRVRSQSSLSRSSAAPRCLRLRALAVSASKRERARRVRRVWQKQRSRSCCLHSPSRSPSSRTSLLSSPLTCSLFFLSVSRRTLAKHFVSHIVSASRSSRRAPSGAFTRSTYTAPYHRNCIGRTLA